MRVIRNDADKRNADNSLIDVKPRYDFKIDFPTVYFKLSHGVFQTQGDFNIIDREMYGKVRVISTSI